MRWSYRSKRWCALWTKTKVETTVSLDQFSFRQRSKHFTLTPLPGSTREFSKYKGSGSLSSLGLVLSRSVSVDGKKGRIDDR